MSSVDTSKIQRLAVVDDDPETTESTMWQVADAGFEPIAFPESRVRDPEHLTRWITEVAQGAVCDHRLMARGFANFYGARVVSDLVKQRRYPGILVTQFVDMDQDVSIRRWRRDIPVLLSRDEANADTIRHGIDMCLAELNGDVPSSRKPYRTLVHVEAIGNESNEDILDVMIPSWNNHHAVRLPMSLLPENLHRAVGPGAWLFADVNIGADRSQDLFFTDFQLAPEPTDNAFS